MSDPLVLFGDKIQPLSECRISPLDRGFLFGDAVYEVFRVYSGRILLLEAHLTRLRRSLDQLRIGGVDLVALPKRLQELLATVGSGEATVYLQISRGAAPTRTHGFPDQAPVPTVFALAQAFGDPHSEKRRSGAKAITQPDQRWGRVDIKTVNLLGNVLAAQAAREAGALESILVGRDGTVTEGSHTNVFGVVAGKLRTKPLSHEILPGVSRDFVLGLARRLGVPVEERALQKEELAVAEELFITGTTLEVMPITSLDGKPVGAGTPGPVTVRLQQGFADEIRRFRG